MIDDFMNFLSVDFFDRFILLFDEIFNILKFAIDTKTFNMKLVKSSFDLLFVLYLFVKIVFIKFYKKSDRYTIDVSINFKLVTTLINLVLVLKYLYEIWLVDNTNEGDGEDANENSLKQDTNSLRLQKFVIVFTILAIIFWLQS